MNHLIDWYSKGFWIAAFALVLWHANKEKEGWSKLAQVGLVLGFTIYAISFSFAQVTAHSKIMLLSRDMILLGFISLVFHAIRHHKTVYWISVILLYAFSKLFVSQWQKSSFNDQTHVLNSENEWEYLVELNHPEDKTKLLDLVKKYDLIIQPAFEMSSPHETNLDNYVAIEVPVDEENNMVDIKADLTSWRNTQWLELNEEITVEPEIPAHEFRNGFKALVNDPHSDKQWAIELLGWNQIIERFTDKKLKAKKKSKIFILDTGVDGQHEDLKSQFTSVDKNSDTDEKGHGTHVAGIAAAVSNNRMGISSILPSEEFTTISSIKVLGKFGAGTQRDIINGIIKAADLGASVINLSLGGRSLDSRQKAYSDAVTYANKKGAIVIVAAGNDNADAKNYAPANADGVIAVSAIDTSLAKASFSNSVQNIRYKLAAPGTDIYSTIPNNQYAAYNGTSMASPYVAGLVGLLKSLQPELTTAEVYEILSSTGVTSKTPSTTGTIIHAGKAVEKLLSPEAVVN